jgi:hypothetical protein
MTKSRKNQKNPTSTPAADSRVLPQIVVPLDLQMLFRACLSKDCIETAYWPALMDADAAAARLLRGSLARDASEEPMWDEAATLPALTDQEHAAVVEEAQKAMAFYFRESGAECFTPETAATEIVGDLQSASQEAGFMLGLCVARRLIRAFAGDDDRPEA